ncbi:MAG: AraC family transcriptional regulator [Verrucomicrobiota bacterium]
MDKQLQSPSPKAADRLQMKYCYGGTALYQPGEVLGPRLLTDFEAVLIIDGFPTYERDSRRYRLKPGSIHVARPGVRERYLWDTEARTRHAYLHFELESVPREWGSPEIWPVCQLQPPPITGHLLRHLMERAVQRADWPAVVPNDGDNRLMEVFLEIYIQGADDSGAESSHDLSEPVRRATQFMRERLDSPSFEPFPLAELAATAHVTPKHLCRTFQKELGVSPMKACRLMQFQLAIPLLARSNLPIKSIAERCGFPDQLHFSKSFRQTFGKSPREIRDEILSGERPPANPLPAALMPRLYW